MKVPVEWLKELVNIKVKPEQLAKILTMSGLETVVESGNILEIDIIPNRSDCWSILGIAREVSALTKTKIKAKKTLVKETGKGIAQGVKVEVRDAKLCPRYMARVIENVKIKPSPAWLKGRLESVGIRAINNIVDVTNYLLHELGQPMHAFDADLIPERKIVVRRANSKEKVATLDGKDHELDKDMLVIADKERAIALAGVIGAANTEVNPKTKNIILESAFFDPVSVHKTSKLLKTRTESSIRFEHGVDWNTVEIALDRAAAMIAELGEGTILKGKLDVKSKALKPKTVTLRPERVNQILGANISNSEMTNILKRLGFKTAGSKITIPLFRAADIYREIDLIEEIARIYGYHKIKTTMPNTSFPDKGINQSSDIFRDKVAQILVGCGFNEAQTYSMVGPKDFDKVGLAADKAIKVANPMNIEESLMRTQLLPSLLNALTHNINRQIEDVFLFEIGKVYLPRNQKLPEERWVLSLVASGSPFLSQLDRKEIDYFYIKGVLENLMACLGISDYKLSETSSHLLQPGKGAEFSGMGILGELHPDIRRNYDLGKPVFFLEIDLDEVFKLSQKIIKYQPLPKFPAVCRDIAMFVPKGVEHQMIMATIKKLGGKLVENVFLFDKYKDSLAYRIVYRDPNRTLTDTEINAKHEELSRSLESKLNVRIRK